MLLRHVARPMLASWFIYDGVQAALKPAEHARRSARCQPGRAAARCRGALSEKQATLLVRAHGTATAIAGLFLATGKAPRSAALTLAALSVPSRSSTSRSPRQGRPAASAPGSSSGTSARSGPRSSPAPTTRTPGVRWRVDRARKDLALAKNAKHQVDAAKDSIGSAADKAAHSVTTKTARATKKARRAARSAVHSATGTVKGVTSH
ncbi:DoxX family protein [Oerskovia sp. M15]